MKIRKCVMETKEEKLGKKENKNKRKKRKEGNWIRK